jgi:hypothetical protein
MPSSRGFRATDDLAREIAGRLARLGLLALGGLIMLVGLALAFLPGHLGVPLLVVGLMIVLRNSFKARRHFVRMQQAYPKAVFPIRRLLRREPEIVLVVWQQSLRVERLIAPARFRVLIRARRWLRRRAGRAATDRSGATVSPLRIEWTTR